MELGFKGAHHRLGHGVFVAVAGVSIEGRAPTSSMRSVYVNTLKRSISARFVEFGRLVANRKIED